MSQPTIVGRSNLESKTLEQIHRSASHDGPGQALKQVVETLRRNFEHYNWVGIYLVKGDDLVLAAYSGDDETEHVRISIGQGICGLAAERGSTIIVPDVNRDPSYLMCFASTRSEIVVPIKSGARVLGEIDVDSDRLSAFSECDRSLLEQAASILADYLEEHPGALALQFSDRESKSGRITGE